MDSKLGLLKGRPTAAAAAAAGSAAAGAAAGSGGRRASGFVYRPLTEEEIGSGRKNISRVRRAVNEAAGVTCAQCHTAETSNWRLGPRKLWLCNECGVEYKKQKSQPKSGATPTAASAQHDVLAVAASTVMSPLAPQPLASSAAPLDDSADMELQVD